MARQYSQKITKVAPTQTSQKRSNIPYSDDASGKRQSDTKGKGKARAVESSESMDKFREAVLALGGDEEDYKLLKDLDSDNEHAAQENGAEDVTLSKDLAKFMKGLDFSSIKPNDSAEQDEDYGESEPEEESDGGASTDAEAPEKSPETKIEKEKQPIAIPKVGKDSHLLIEPTPQWYAAVPPLQASGPGKPSIPSPQTLAAQQSKAVAMHASELEAYERATGASANKLASSASDAAFLQRVLSGGTLADRLSALTLMAQSSPLHNIRALETLRGMAQKKGREESLKALRAIVDWWAGGAAPDRKLKYFADQPLSQQGVTEKHLLVWYFEDWLKKYFYSVLQLLEALSLDPLPYVRTQAMALIFTLLCDKPEQEQNLLRLLVNKLGDSERPVASRASYYLLRLLQVHPQMKAVVIREVSALILRPRTGVPSVSTTQSGATHLKFSDTPATKPSAPAKAPAKGKGKGKSVPQDKTKKDLQQEHARYYATITLNQIMLAPTEADRSVAAQLVGLYFDLFKEILGSTSSEQPLGEGLANVGGEDFDHTRFGKEKRKKQEERGGKGKGKESGEVGFAEVEDDSSKLISAILTGVNRALPYAKLGPDNVEFSKHIDTLFLICHKSTFNISLQALRLILQITQSLTSAASTSDSSKSLSTSITDRYYRTLYASLFDNRLSTSSKQAMYLNLLLKSLKMDMKKERVKALVRRFVQVLVSAGNGGVEFVAGGLYLLGEIFKEEPGLRELLNKPPKRMSTTDAEYDPRKRDPQYAHADTSPMWELTVLLSHFHPTVRLHATQLLSGKPLTAHADLALNTLAHFLDRFVYRNPKAPRTHGASAMQPAAVAPSESAGVRAPKAGATVTDNMMVNDAAFWKRDVKNVPVDQVFFHKYFSQKSVKERARADKVAKRKGGAEEDDEEDQEDEESDKGDESVDETAPVSKKEKIAASTGGASENEDEDESDADEEEIWKAIKSTHPDLRGDAEDPSDSELSLGSDTEGSESDAEDGEETKIANANANDYEEEDEDDEGNDSDALSLAERSSAASLVALSDIELPEGLIAYNPDSDDSNSDAGHGEENDDAWGGFDSEADSNRKRKRGTDAKKSVTEKSQSKNKKRRLRALPTFATYEDYAALIDGEPEDNI